MTEYIGWLDEDHAPVVDMAQEVVRCRDCRHFDDRFHYQLCRRDMSCDELAVFAEPDGFCAWAERRDA